MLEQQRHPVCIDLKNYYNVSMPFHVPGYRYCGPGTNIEESDRAGRPVNELDAICRTHDLDLQETSKLSQKEADQKFIESAPKTGFIGNVLSSLLSAKSLFIEAEPGLEKYLPGTKEEAKKLEQPQARVEKENLHKFQPKFSSTPKRQKLQRPQQTLTRTSPFLNKLALHPSTAKDSGFGSQSKSTTNTNKRKGSYTDQFNKKLKETKEETNQNMSQPIGTGENQINVHSHGGPTGEPEGTTVHQNVTKQILMKYSRTLRHYIQLPTDVDNKTKQGWSDIPYQHICASMKPSDWQGLNTFARRWTPIKCGFVLHHIIPIENTISSTGGAIAPKVLYQTQPYLETFIDEDMILPIQKIYTLDKLPNTNMANNSDVTTKSTLTHVEWEK